MSDKYIPPPQPAGTNIYSIWIPISISQYRSWYQECDEASVSSDSDLDPGTDDSGVDSINSDPQLNMLSTLSERGETESQDSGGDSAGVRSFLWSRAATKTPVNQETLMSPHHHLLAQGEIHCQPSHPSTTLGTWLLYLLKLIKRWWCEYLLSIGALER